MSRKMTADSFQLDHDIDFFPTASDAERVNLPSSPSESSIAFPKSMRVSRRLRLGNFSYV